MSRHLVTATAALSLCAGPALAQPQNSNPVYAIVGERLLFGMSRPSAVDDTGAIALQSVDTPPLACTVSYSYATGGKADFACSDGLRGRLPYQGYSANTGTGRGVINGTKISVCYGFQPKDAPRHLSVPAGYELVVEDGQLMMKRTDG